MDFRRIRHPIAPGGKAPEPGDGVQRWVQNPASPSTQLQGLRQKRDLVRLQLHGLSPVELIQKTAHPGDGVLGLQCLKQLLQLQAGLRSRRPPEPQPHHRIHGKQLPLYRRRSAAAGQAERGAQDQNKDTPERAQGTFHLIPPFMKKDTKIKSEG